MCYILFFQSFIIFYEGPNEFYQFSEYYFCFFRDYWILELKLKNDRSSMKTSTIAPILLFTSVIVIVRNIIKKKRIYIS